MACPAALGYSGSFANCVVSPFSLSAVDWDSPFRPIQTFMLPTATTPNAWIRKPLVFPVACLISFLTAAVALGCQPALETAAAADSPDTGTTVRLGLGGIIRLGHWVPAIVTLRDGDLAARVDRIEIICSDDADVPVVWSQKTDCMPATGPRGGSVYRAEGLFRLGRPDSSIAVRLLDGAGGVLVEWESGTGSGADLRIVDGTTRLVLLLGQSDAFAGVVPLVGSEAPQTLIARLDSALEVPSHFLGFQSAARMVAGGSDGGLLKQLDASQVQALALSVRRGARLLVIASPDNVPQGVGLQSLLPGTVGGQTALGEANRLEVFSKSRTQLAVSRDAPVPLTGLDPSPDATVLLAENGSAVFVRQTAGFGSVIWSGIPLDEEPLVGWSGTSAIVEQLLLGSLSETRSATTGQFVADSQNGFTDLAGQLRMALESFDSVRLVSFTAVAMLAALGVLLFGVGDWFLLRHLIRVPAWTWLTFPAMALGICAVSWTLHHRARPAEPRENSLEWIDIDQVSGLCRGSRWNCLYSPRSGSGDFSLHSLADWMGTPQLMVTGWQGHPGAGLGGMLTRTGISLSQGNYRVTSQREGDTFRSGVSAMSQTPSSARLFFSEYQAQLPPGKTSRLRLDRLNDRLEGTIVNSTPLTIRRGRVFYGGLVYLLPRDLEPGASIEVPETVMRTVKSVLNRRERVEDKTRKDLSASTPWDGLDTDLFRIASMIQFHSLAGGSPYTGLGNAYYDSLEMSDLVQSRRAVLMGEYAGSTSRFASGGVSGPADGQVAIDRSLRLVRIVMPIDPP